MLALESVTTTLHVALKTQLMAGAATFTILSGAACVRVAAVTSIPVVTKRRACVLIGPPGSAGAGVMRTGKGKGEALPVRGSGCYDRTFSLTVTSLGSTPLGTT